MRLRKIPTAAEYLARAENVHILADGVTAPFTLERGKSIELEIGCGKGAFSIAKAMQNRNIHYYALEKYDSVLIKAVQKAAVHELDNLTFLLGDATNISRLFPPASLSNIYLNFSDPWPKFKHAKRRLTYRDKLTLYGELLAPDGTLAVKTDSQRFFESTLRELTTSVWKITEISLDLYGTDDFVEVKAYQSEYEQKFIAQGKRIFYLRATK